MIKLKDSMATYNLIIHRVREQTVPFNGLILPVAGRISKFCFPGKTHGGSLCREKQKTLVRHSVCQYVEQE